MLTLSRCYYTLASFISLSLMTSSALAASNKTIQQQFDVADLATLELNISIGELEIEIVDSQQLQVEISLEAERRLFGLRAGSVDAIELATNQSATTLFLGIDVQDVTQHWIVQVPRHLAMTISLGVGDVQIEKLENSLDMEIGVGSVRVDVIETAFADIHLSTGVGDAAIRGMQSKADNERSFISADAYYEGDGKHHITIDMDVGEVLVRKD